MDIQIVTEPQQREEEAADTVIVHGKTYRLARLNESSLRSFFQWARQHTPDPMATLGEDIKGLPPEIQKELALEAYRSKQQIRMGNAELFQQLAATPEGAIQIWTLAFKRHQPHLNEEAVEQILQECADEHPPEYLLDKFKTIMRIPDTE